MKHEPRTTNYQSGTMSDTIDQNNLRSFANKLVDMGSVVNQKPGQSMRTSRMSKQLIRACNTVRTNVLETISLMKWSQGVHSQVQGQGKDNRNPINLSCDRSFGLVNLSCGHKRDSHINQRKESIDRGCCTRRTSASRAGNSW